MARKEYFSHDYNARQDPKIMMLIKDFGMEGYGIYWAIIEMMHEQGGYIEKNSVSAIAFYFRMDENAMQDLFDKYDLFKKNKKYYYSDRVIKNITERQEKSDIAKKAAAIRWGGVRVIQEQSDSNADALQEQCNSYAIKDKDKDKDIYIKKERIKERKDTADKPPECVSVRPSKNKYGANKNVLLTVEEHKKLYVEFEEGATKLIDDLSFYLASTGKVYKSHYMTILNWKRKDKATPNRKQAYQSCLNEIPD